MESMLFNVSPKNPQTKMPLNMVLRKKISIRRNQNTFHSFHLHYKIKFEGLLNFLKFHWDKNNLRFGALQSVFGVTDLSCNFQSQHTPLAPVPERFRYNTVGLV